MIRSEAICREKKNVSVDPQHTLFEQCSSSPDLSFQHIKRKYRNLRSQKKNNNLSGNPFSRVFFFSALFQTILGHMYRIFFFSPIGNRNNITLTGNRPPSISFYHESTRQRKSKDWKDEEEKKRRGSSGGGCGCVLPYGGGEGGLS
jgi:hypothetical protein